MGRRAGSVELEAEGEGWGKKDHPKAKDVNFILWVSIVEDVNDRGYELI